MRPQFAAIMSGTAACTQWKAPVRLMDSVRSHSSSADVGERFELGYTCAGDDDMDRAELSDGQKRPRCLLPHGR